MSEVVHVQGRAVPVIGNDIDTDRIIPARYLKEITFSRMGRYPFYDERFTADGGMKDHPFNTPHYQGASILVANSNFGCGSSREHAPQALFRWGIRAIVAESFGEIFAGNCAMLGVPAVTASSADVAALQALAMENPAVPLVVDLEAMVVRAGAMTVPVTMPGSRRNSLIQGTWDSSALLLANAGLVKAAAARLPHPSAARISRDTPFTASQ
jgi:3-isopropylmalate/(R)-2-methylmalate dehydratase small subunit